MFVHIRMDLDSLIQSVLLKFGIAYGQNLTSYFGQNIFSGSCLSLTIINVFIHIKLYSDQLDFGPSNWTCS